MDNPKPEISEKARPIAWKSVVFFDFGLQK